MNNEETPEEVATAARDLRRKFQADPRMKFPQVSVSFADLAAVVDLVERLARVGVKI